MEDNEELVTEVTENVDELATEELVDGNTEPVNEEKVEESTETISEPVKTYTDEEVNDIVKKKLFRQEQKLNKQFNKQLSSYKRAEEVLNAGLGTSNIEEATDNLTNFYKEKGISIPEYHEQRSEHEIEVLANDEAKSIIEAGYEDIVEEVDRLAEIGINNMSKRDKIIFQLLADERTKIENEKEVESLGISKDEINTKEFKDFSKKLNPSLSMKEKYEMYSQMKPRKDANIMGSMNSTPIPEKKTFISEKEYDKMTEQEIAENMDLIRESMYKW